MLLACCGPATARVSVGKHHVFGLAQKQIHFVWHILPCAAAVRRSKEAFGAHQLLLCAFASALYTVWTLLERAAVCLGRVQMLSLKQLC